LRRSTDGISPAPSCTLELALLVECKDATATALFVIVAATAHTFLITTPMLCLLEAVLELEDLCWNDSIFLFKGRVAALHAAISSLQRGGSKLRFQEKEMRGREVLPSMAEICKHKF